MQFLSIAKAGIVGQRERAPPLRMTPNGFREYRRIHV